jgi:sulfite reductase (NADPH) flavoprotein alpha-component
MSDPGEPSGYNKDNPFQATLTENRILNGEGSAKDTRHLVINLAGSGLRYDTGDSIGVYPTNEPEKVQALLDVCGFTGEETVSLPKTEGGVRLSDALARKLSLAQPGRKFLDFLLTKATDEEQRSRLEELVAKENAATTRVYLENLEYLDLLEEFSSARPDAQELADQMRRLNPRLYSIASSYLAFPQEVHLTVAPVRYTTNGRDRRGVCSTFLADRIALNDQTFPIFVSSSHFGLTEDPACDIIMVGPGTGIAPFRAFLQEREKTGATGRNWLFFGDQHEATDYLYQEEFEGYLKSGLLHRIDLAWSRDQDFKIYVQDRIRENAAEIWSWLSGGACFYVCGDAKRMAKDVDTALRNIMVQEGKMTAEEAVQALKLMRREKRYLRDVY